MNAFPRLTVRHTSQHIMGQVRGMGGRQRGAGRPAGGRVGNSATICRLHRSFLPAWLRRQVYIPEANWLLLIGAIVVVGVFETSSKIGNGACGGLAGQGG